MGSSKYGTPWQETTLNDVCIKITDGAHLSPKSVETGMPMASVKDLTSFGITIDTCRHISQKDFDKLIHQGCQPLEGDILIAKDGATALDTVCVMRKTMDVVLLSSVAILRPNKTKIFPSYLRHYLDSETTRSYMKAAFTTGAAIPRVVLKDFKLARILLPPLLTQRKIAAILSAYDDLIENNLRRIKILEEMAQNLYREWFVKFRFPGHEQARFVDSALGRIPEGWEVKRILDLGNVITGKTPSKANPDFYGEDVPFVKTPDMHGNTFILDVGERLSVAGAKSQANKTIPAGSICVSCIGTIGVVSITTKPCQTNQQINSVVLAKKQFCEFLFQRLKDAKQALENLGSNGATMCNVNKGKFESIEIIVPSDELIICYHEFAKPLFSEMLILSRKNAALRRTRDLLLPKLISGEVDVSELDIAIPEEAVP